MSVTATRAGFGPRLLFLAAVLLCLAACSKKQEEARHVPDLPGADTGASPDAQAASADTVAPAPESPADALAPVEETVNQVPRTEVRPGRPTFLGKPPTTAWRGRPYVFQPTFGSKRLLNLRLVEGPDGMLVKGAAVHWIPSRLGRFPVTLEAGADSSWGRLAYVVEVKAVLALVLKPLPEQAGKGDTVIFDMGGSAYPKWAEDSIMLRFDYEGDGKWDAEGLPLAANLRHAHAYRTVGRFAPKVEARYLDREAATAEGRISVTSSVDARLVLQPDTADPGASVSVDASASLGDGRLTYLLDLDGDGKPDWSDSATGRGSVKAPSSGRYLAALTVRNSMGMAGKAAAVLVVNARPKVSVKIRNAKENMAMPVEVLVEAADGDDSLRSVRVNFTGAPDAWQTSSRPDSAKGPGRWRKTFKHAYGKVGKFALEGCAASADGRETCRKAQVEIFNAPPAVEPGPDVKATLGVPAEIVGIAGDPDGAIVKWEWDLDGDGKYDVASKKDGRVKYTFARKGTFSLNLRVTTADGMTATSARRVEVRKQW